MEENHKYVYTFLIKVAACSKMWGLGPTYKKDENILYEHGFRNASFPSYSSLPKMSVNTP
jgi:hypothetical protein